MKLNSHLKNNDSKSRFLKQSRHAIFGLPGGEWKSRVHIDFAKPGDYSVLNDSGNLLENHN